MKKIDVMKKGNEWIGKTSKEVVVRAPTKEKVVREAAAVAKADPKPVSVRIRKLDGTFQEERTYPGSADPRSSKG